ncbi:hypothetical protein BAU18_001593 [Enterococcus diestrammenae]|uniref:HTH cro/C1-type domain-containing protein n=2 Tax=Enterococcus TaxID=1350 RepID=A0ABV0F1R6_9ENTE
MTRLRALREDYDLTIRELSNYLHCDYSLYSKYERGEREIPIRYLLDLRKLYGYNLEYILDLTDYSNKLPPKRKKLKNFS